jgi:hypothetical protein
MSEMVKRTWSAMDGALVFDLSINREPGDGNPSTAVVSCKSAAGDSQTLSISAQFAQFNYRFRSGHYAVGFLRQIARVQVDGIAHTAIWGDFRVGTAGRDDDHHFEGIMVSVPTRGIAPPVP